MLTELCAYLKNWFDEDEFHHKLPRWEESFSIVDKKIDLTGKVADGQLFRIYGSMLNDGVYVYSEDLELKDETFNGLIQSMRTEPDFLAIAKEIEKWTAKYGTASSLAMSPFGSESFGGYAYSKSSGYRAGSNTGSSVDPIAEFGSRLARWKKI